MRRTIVDLCVQGDAPDADELAAALSFVGKEAPTAHGARPMTGPRIDRYVLDERLATAPGAELFAARRGHEPAAPPMVLALLNDAASETASRAPMSALCALMQRDSPHVARLLDVGMHWGRTFAVFAPQRGEPLGAWLLRPRQRAEILAVYLDVARGIASCRAAGLLGTFFSPSTVLVDPQGRARVVAPALGVGVGLDETAEGFWRSLEAAVARHHAAAPDASVATPCMPRWTDTLPAMVEHAAA